MEACCLVILAAESKVSRVGTRDPGPAHPHPYPDSARPIACPGSTHSSPSPTYHLTHVPLSPSLIPPCWFLLLLVGPTFPSPMWGLWSSHQAVPLGKTVGEWFEAHHRAASLREPPDTLLFNFHIFSKTRAGMVVFGSL